MLNLLIENPSGLDSVTQSVIDSLPANVAVLDQSGTIIAVNAAWHRFGQQNGLKHPHSCVGQNYLRTTAASKSTEPLAQIVLKELSAVLWGRKSHFEIEYPCHSANEQRWFLMTADRLKGSSERRVIICHHNITQRVLAERKALEANNNLKQLCAMLAHDFRSPLTSVKGSITLVRKMFSDKLSEKALACLEIAEQTADHLVALSTDFLDLQRDGSLSVQIKPESVEDIFSSAFGLVNGIAAKQQIEIVVSTAPDLFVECDKSSILRALNNLLTNALKYSPSGKAVFLEAFAEKEQIVFSVRDEGPGIDENRLHQLFEPFGYSKPSELLIGSGLGLAAVKRLLALNKSEVELKTASNEGTTFSFRLPRAYVAMQLEATSPSASEHGNLVDMQY